MALVAIGAGYWVWQRSQAAKSAQTETISKAISNLKPAQVSISNVEAIEERRVWEFRETDGIFGQFGFSDSLKLAWSRARATPGEQSFFVLTTNPIFANRYGVIPDPGISELIIAPGSIYDQSPRSPGTNPMSFSCLLAVVYSNPPAPGGKGGGNQGYAFRVIAIAREVDPAVWSACWSSRIATAGEQIDAGGIVTVGSKYL